MANYKHIIWDWNGTIIDDAHLCLSIYNQMAIEYSMPQVQFNYYIENMNFPVISFYKDNGWDFDKIDFREVGKKFVDMYNAQLPKNPFHCDVLKTLQFLKTVGITSSILSAHQDALLKSDVEKLGISQYFCLVDGMSDIYGNSKRELGIAHIKKIPHRLDEVLMIGDTIHDKEAADAMGVNCVLIARGHNSKRRLEQSQAQVFDTLEEFLSANFNFKDNE